MDTVVVGVEVVTVVVVVVGGAFDVLITVARRNFKL